MKISKDLKQFNERKQMFQANILFYTRLLNHAAEMMNDDLELRGIYGEDEGSFDEMLYKVETAMNSVREGFDYVKRNIENV